jgi:hypothetical protein
MQLSLLTLHKFLPAKICAAQAENKTELFNTPTYSQSSLAEI